jgi:hypothetical protein
MPLHVDCSLIVGSCGFIISVTISQHYPDYYHSIEFTDDDGHSVILGLGIVYANYVAINERELRTNLKKGVPYQWRVVLRRVADNSVVARGQWSTDRYVSK